MAKGIIPTVYATPPTSTQIAREKLLVIRSGRSISALQPSTTYKGMCIKLSLLGPKMPTNVTPAVIIDHWIAKKT